MKSKQPLDTLFVSDLDGTLLRPDGTLSERTIAVLNRIAERPGWGVTYATARGVVSTVRALEQTPLRYPLIVMNGIGYYDPRRRRIFRRFFLRGSVFRSIIAAALGLGLNPYVFSARADGSERIAYRSVKNSAEEFFIASRKMYGDRRLDSVNAIALGPGERVNIIVLIERKERLAPLLPFLDKLDCGYHFTEDVYTPGWWWVEALHRKGNKRHGVDYLRRTLRPRRIVAFGDNLNDLGLFEAADEAYAMANARLELKERATGVLASNAEDGVAEFLEKRLEADHE